MKPLIFFKKCGIAKFWFKQEADLSRCWVFIVFVCWWLKGWERSLKSDSAKIRFHASDVRSMFVRMFKLVLLLQLGRLTETRQRQISIGHFGFQLIVLFFCQVCVSLKTTSRYWNTTAPNFNRTLGISINCAVFLCQVCVSSKTIERYWNMTAPSSDWTGWRPRQHILLRVSQLLLSTLMLPTLLLWKRQDLVILTMKGMY